MQEWVLEELAMSYLENGGFWAYEPLLVVEEKIGRKKAKVVVEGNRRLAALKTLKSAFDGNARSPKWKSIADEYSCPAELFESVPYVTCDSREDVTAFLGFRHVTGIKQWNSDEKAAYIAKLVQSGMSYQEVARKIGSKTPTVRKHFIAFRTLVQIEDEVEEYHPELGENRFAVLYMSIDTVGAKNYLRIDMTASTESLMRPVPKDRIAQLANFSRWLFGTKDSRPLVIDTRQISDFAAILESEKAVKYLESKEKPQFEMAMRISGGDESQTIEYVLEAAENTELALMRAHAHTHSDELQAAVARLGQDVVQLLKIFPEVYAEMMREVQ
jgi:hypothetical protein